MTIGWLKIRWHCVVLVDEHRLLFTTAFNLDFIIDVIIEIANMDTVNIIHFSMMYSLFFVAVPIDGVAYLKLWTLCHVYLLNMQSLCHSRNCGLM